MTHQSIQQLILTYNTTTCYGYVYKGLESKI